jgi:hypothetical protein
MADQGKPLEDRTTTGVDRRQFVQGLGAAGALGAVSGLGPFAAGADAAGPQAGGGDEFPKPDKLLPGAQLDSRFPVSFATPVREGFRLLTDYFTALNQRDVRGLASVLHFPFAIYEGREPLVVDSEANFVASPPPTLNGTGRGDTRIAPGSYDLLESMNVHLYGPVGGAFSLSFTRYTADGHKLLACDGIYGVTNNDGRWAIQMASTIFHEADFIGLKYPDAEQATIRGDENYLAQFGYGNEDVLNDPTTSRGSYEPPLPVGWRTARVDFGYGPRERSRNAREGHPMSGWRTRGVTNRLRVSTVTEASQNRTLETNLPEFIELAGGAAGQYSYTRDRPVRPILIHATHDKAHTLNGYFRYTADGILISETRGVGIRVYVKGNWASAGGFGQVTHHDRSNSKG